MFSVSSMTAPLRKVALRKPGASLLEADADVWHYGPTYGPEHIKDEYAAFVSLLENSGAEIFWIDGNDQGNADAVFTYDASLMTPAGAILMSPGKALRSGEQDLHEEFYQQWGIPVLGRINGSATAEAGDTLWLDDKTLVIGRGFRTNIQGVAQIEALVAKIGINAQVFDLPVFYGQSACMHLMSLISLVDTKTALVCKPFLPVGLWQLLHEMNFRILEAPMGEFESSGTLSTNILATSPGQCIMIEGLPQTRALLENAGICVQVFSGDALCVGCEGGPTCLTRPLYRA